MAKEEWKRTIGFMADIDGGQYKENCLTRFYNSYVSSKVPNVLGERKLVAAACMVSVSAFALASSPEWIGQQAGELARGYNTAVAGAEYCKADCGLRPIGEAVGSWIARAKQGYETALQASPKLKAP